MLGCELPNERPESFERVLCAVAADLEAYDWREEAQRLEVPPLLVHGVNDHFAPVQGAREWAEVLPDARLTEIQGAGHLVRAERRNKVRAAIGRFLNGQDTL